MYFIFLIVILLFSLIASKKNKKVIYFIFSFILGIIYSLRSYQVGNDTENYLYYYNRVHHLYLVNSYANNYEPIYHFLIRFSPFFEFYLFLVAFLTFYLISLSFEKINDWMTSFLFLLAFGFFNIAVDQSRQILGISFFLYLLHKFKYNKNILSGLIASLVHISNLLIVPFVILFNYLDEKKITIPNYVYLSLLFGSLIFGINKYWQFFLYTILGSYAPESVYVAERFYMNNGDNGGSGLMYYRFFLVFLLLIIFFKQKKLLGFNLIFSGLIIQISSIGFMPIERVGTSIFFVGLVILTNKDLSFGLNKWRKIIIFLYAMIYFIQTNIMNIEKHGSVPWTF
jgi:hypothetical protein